MDSQNGKISVTDIMVFAMTGMMLGNFVVGGILKLHLSPSIVRMKMTMFFLSYAVLLCKG